MRRCYEEPFDVPKKGTQEIENSCNPRYKNIFMRNRGGIYFVSASPANGRRARNRIILTTFFEFIAFFHNTL